MSRSDPAIDRAGHGRRVQPDDAIVVDAPAKVNLGLRILGTRRDGYHLLESVFVPIDWSDSVRLGWAPTGAREVSLEVEIADDARGVSAATLSAGADNLVHRAAEAFLEEADLHGHVAITLVKRLPAGAGLGGGSSDAGAVLRGLATLHPGALPADDCAKIAVALGADVPFFLDPQPAFVSGIGERVDPLAGVPPLTLVLANPGEPLSTPAVFRAYDALRTGREPVAGRAVETADEAVTDVANETRAEPAAPGRFLAAWADWLSAPGSANASGGLAPLLHNDLQDAALRLCPPVGRLLRALEDAGAVAVSMSGSGATVFGVFDDASEAKRVAETLDRAGPGWARAVRTSGAA